MKHRIPVLVLGAALCASWPALAQQAAGMPAAEATPRPIATVNGKKIERAVYERALAATMRQRFYHGTVPEGEAEKLRRDVAEGLVNRLLIVSAAQARGYTPDAEAIEKELEGYENRYRDSPVWKAQRERVLPELRRELSEQHLFAKMEAEVRKRPDPTPAEVRAFYDAKPELFTQPAQVHLSVILLRVDPSAGKAARDKAREEAKGLHERLKKGADFAQLAKIHSSDPTAPKGGDMGFVHRGMLAEALQQEVDKMELGGFSAPVEVLEGVSLFRLHERKPAALREFEAVKQRAFDLAKRENAERAWKEFTAGLRTAASVEMDPAWAAGMPRGD